MIRRIEQFVCGVDAGGANTSLDLCKNECRSVASTVISMARETAVEIDAVKDQMTTEIPEVVDRIIADNGFAALSPDYLLAFASEVYEAEGINDKTVMQVVCSGPGLFGGCTARVK